MSTKKITLTASRVRIILSLVLVAAIIGASSLFVYGRNYLEQYAVEVSHKRIDAQASDSSLQALESIKSELANNKDVVEKAQSLKASNKIPQFKIFEDIKRHAQRNGITIQSYTFNETTAPGATAAPPTSGMGSAPGKSSPSATASSSAKNVAMTITLGPSTSYTQLLQFIHDIEQNIPKMQLQGISLSSSAAGNSTVSIEPIVIQMYTR